jgi:hypothetical protein
MILNDRVDGECNEVSRRELWIAAVGLWSVLIALLLLFVVTSEKRAEQPTILPLTNRV